MFDLSDYLYMIGNYVFTQGHNLTTQDIMLAARSIQSENTGETNAEQIYKDMAIYLLEPSGSIWKATQVAGETKLKPTFDIKMYQ